MSEQRNYMAEVQALIDQKWKENPEEMKRVMAEIKAKEKQKSKKAETPKVVPIDPELTKELITEMNKAWDDVDISKLQDLVARGADVGAKNNDGSTPLHFACGKNALECAKLLIARGADVEAKDNGGETPLHRAKSEEMKDLLKKYM